MEESFSSELLREAIDKVDNKVDRVDSKVDIAIERISEVRTKIAYLEGKAAGIGAVAGLLAAGLLKLLGL